MFELTEKMVEANENIQALAQRGQQIDSLNKAWVELCEDIATSTTANKTLIH